MRIDWTTPSTSSARCPSSSPSRMSKDQCPGPRYSIIENTIRSNTNMVRRLIRPVGAYGAVIGSARYRPLWAGQLVSAFGDTLHYIALVVLVFELTGQGIAIAGLVAAEIAPVLLLGPVAGVVIDRFSRKAVLIVADV